MKQKRSGATMNTSKSYEAKKMLNDIHKRKIFSLLAEKYRRRRRGRCWRRSQAPSMLWLVAITGAKEAYTAGVGIADGYAKRGGLSKETANQRRSTADTKCIGKK